MSRPWTYPEIDGAVARIRAGEHLADIAADLGRSASAVCKAVRRRTGKSVSGLRGRRPPCTHPPEVARRCAALRRCGQSYKRIAEHVGVPLGSVPDLIRRGRR